MTLEDTQIRINKLLADAGVASRRAIDRLIFEGRVSVNGVIAKTGQKASTHDTITINGKNIPLQRQEYVYILLNKPDDCTTTAHDERGRRTVFKYVSVPQRIFPVGRLDRNTTGVLLLTNDGDLANTLMHPRFSVEKTYYVSIHKPLIDTHTRRLESGIMLDGKKTSPATISIQDTNRKKILITIHEGMNRQVHRMFEALGYEVLALDRTNYAGLTTGTLKRGEWRYLKPEELKKLSTNCLIDSP